LKCKKEEKGKQRKLGREQKERREKDI